jgi:peroxiredoxin|tara:strand:+ start:995 stop:1489 length:495 start_codon:yes stop_codon:yes gene_type:complete
MVIKVGDNLPASSFMWMGTNSEIDVRVSTSDEIFGGKKVAVFGLPGAYTPVCSADHLPGFVKVADSLLEKGIDSVVCISINDPFVMDAWAKTQGVGDNIQMLCDPTAAFTSAVGLDLELADFGLGVRSERYSMIVDNGVVIRVNIEESILACDASSADALLSQV